MEKMLQEAPAPTLTLEPFAEEKEEPAVVEKEEAGQPVDEKEKIKAQKETTEALKRVAELEKILQCKTTEGK